MGNKDTPQWEIDYRNKLNEELQHGAYSIGVPGKITALTGKGGYIEYLVSLERDRRNFISNSTGGILNTKPSKLKDGFLTKEELDNLIKDIFNGR